MNKTKIDWCTHTLNPVVGCTFGCPYCYAKRMNNRFNWVKDFEEPQFFPERLKMLYSKSPKIIFTDSMSDIADWKPNWLNEIFRSILDNPQHKYLFLTKRMPDYGEIIFDDGYERLFKVNASENIYFGSSITHQNDFISLDEYGQISDFLSIEPILESIDLTKYEMIKYVKWVIIGAETGNRKDKIISKKEWIENIAEQCKVAKIPLFMKSSLAEIWGEPLIQEFPW